MKKLQKQKVDALTRFKNYCEANTTVWSGLPAFITAVAELGVKLQAILNTEGQQEKNNKGVTQKKSELKAAMANSVVIIAEACQGYATWVGDATLFNLMKITYSTIFREKNSGSISKSELVCDKAANLLSELGPFGISDAVIETTRALIEGYKNVQSSTGIVITDKKNYTRNLDLLIKEGNTIMRKQLLKTGRQFIASNPDFYYGMVDSAKVITTVVHTKLKILVSAANDLETPLAGCMVEIESTDHRGLTDVNGKCTVSSVPEGKQTVIISKQGYTTLRMDEVQFNRGKSTTLNKFLALAAEMPAVIVGKSMVDV